MKAAVVEQLNTPLKIWQLAKLPLLKRGQVLVKIAYTGVCHSQVMEARGRRGPDRFLPHLLGHEATGVVQEIGEGVSKVRPGDKVVLTWVKSEGIDAGGVQIPHDGRILNGGAVTTFSEVTIVSENRLVKLPEGMPMDLAVLFGCAILTGAGMVTNTLQPKAGSSIAVFGLGGIGLSAIMATQLFKSSMVIGIDIDDAKLELAKSFGATHTVHALNENPVEAVRALTGGLGVDYSVEASGSARGIENAFNSVRRGGGRCVFASHPQNGELIHLDPFELIAGKTIEGSWGGDSRPDRDIPAFAKLYMEGRLPLEKMVGKRYSLDQINEALDDLEARRVVRPLIVVDSRLG